MCPMVRSASVVRSECLGGVVRFCRDEMRGAILLSPDSSMSWRCWISVFLGEFFFMNGSCHRSRSERCHISIRVGGFDEKFEIKLDLIRISFVCRVKVHDVYLGLSLRSGRVSMSRVRAMSWENKRATQNLQHLPLYGCQPITLHS